MELVARRRVAHGPASSSLAWSSYTPAHETASGADLMQTLNSPQSMRSSCVTIWLSQPSKSLRCPVLLVAPKWYSQWKGERSAALAGMGTPSAGTDPERASALTVGTKHWKLETLMTLPAASRALAASWPLLL